MKVKKLENFGSKMGLKGCKWFSVNAPGTETPLSNPILWLGEVPQEWYKAQTAFRAASGRDRDCPSLKLTEVFLFGKPQTFHLLG